nr:MaoC family dehydratase N-terminal domain-containing protein [Salsipaludibacter albus]
MNTDRIGHTYPPVTYDVSRAKIREYAAALGETDPRYSSDGDDCVAPPTFAACFTIMQGAEAMLGDDELGAHFNLVHGSQGYEWGERALRPGDRLHLTTRIADIVVRRGNELLTLEVDCRFADTDERAVLSTSMLVLLGSAPTDDPRPCATEGA